MCSPGPAETPFIYEIRAVKAPDKLWLNFRNVVLIIKEYSRNDLVPQDTGPFPWSLRPV